MDRLGGQKGRKGEGNGKRLGKIGMGGCGTTNDIRPVKISVHLQRGATVQGRGGGEVKGHTYDIKAVKI